MSDSLNPINRPIKLSSGDDSTLGNWRRLTAALLGEDSPATAFIDAKIAEQGADQPVISDEGQFLHVLLLLHTIQPPTSEENQ